MALIVGLLLFPARSNPASAQSAWTIQGRVVDSGSGAEVLNALVTLDGFAPVLSAEGGFFRFERVPTGRYGLRVEAPGYQAATLQLNVASDTVVIIRLDIRPIELDGLEVTLRTIDFRGRVRDPGTGGVVADAEVISDQGHRESTHLSGGFDLDDVYDGPLLRVFIRAFSFLPLDTTFVPADDDRYPFELAPDPIMMRMIEQYVARLDQRAGDRIYEYQPALNRAELAKFLSNTSLRVAMEARYPLHILARIGCFILDERECRFHSYEERVSVLEGTMANDLERIELLEFPGIGRMFMVRVYTRRFFQSRVGTEHELARPSMNVVPGGPICR